MDARFRKNELRCQCIASNEDIQRLTGQLLIISVMIKSVLRLQSCYGLKCAEAWKNNPSSTSKIIIYKFLQQMFKDRLSRHGLAHWEKSQCAPKTKALKIGLKIFESADVFFLPKIVNFFFGIKFKNKLQPAYFSQKNATIFRNFSFLNKKVLPAF